MTISVFRNLWIKLKPYINRIPEIFFFTIPFMGFNIPKYVLALWIITILPKARIYALKKYFMFIIYFLVLCVGLLYSDFEEGTKQVLKNVFFVLIPFAISSDDSNNIQKLVRAYVIGVLAIITVNVLLLIFHGNLLYYYELSNLVKLHPGYYSLMICTSIILCLKFKDKYKYAFILPQIIMLFLLESRMISISLIIALLMYGFLSISGLKKRIVYLFVSLFLLGGIMLYFTKYEKRSGGLVKITKIIETELNDLTEVYDRDDESYLFLRVNTFKSSIKIFTQDYRTVLFGVGPGDVTKELLTEYNNSKFGSGKYYQYNSHNQFLSTLVKSGLLGLISLLCCFINYNLYYNKTTVTVLLVFLMYSLTESFLEREHGILLFVSIIVILLNIDNNAPLIYEDSLVFSRKKSLPPN